MDPCQRFANAGVLDGLEKITGEDGSTVYTGTATAQAIADTYPEDLPVLGFPLFDGGDPNALVNVAITVASDGIIQSWICSFSDRAQEVAFTSTCAGLGSSADIPAPDPSEVTEAELSTK